MQTIRPSGSHEWYHCNGSQLMQDGLPNDDSTSTKEGTACHWVASEIASSYTNSYMELKTSSDFIDKISPNNVLINQEMCQASIDYVTDILKYCNEFGLLQDVHIEETLNLDTIFPGMKGTPDAWIYNSAAAELIVWDLKYGFGFVDEYENPQLLIYVAGILAKLNVDGISDQHLTIKMRIVQPRCYSASGSIREWKVTASDLRGNFNKIRYAAINAMTGKGICKSGTHCRHCKARFKCPALQMSVYNAIDITTGPVDTELTGNNLAYELQLLKRASKLLEYRIAGIESQVETEIKNGKNLPGFMLKKNYTRLSWKKDTSTTQVLMMADALGVDIRKPDNLDTPTQAKVKFKAKAKELKITLDDSVITQYSEVRFKDYSVVEGDNTREILEAFRKD